MTAADDHHCSDLPLGYLLQRAASILRAEVITTVLEPLQLTFAQYVCLRLLSLQPGRSNAELARSANVSPQAMNTVLRGLQLAGLVSRPATAASGRALPTELTEAGVARLADTVDGITAAERKVLGHLDTRQHAELKRLLASVSD